MIGRFVVDRAVAIPERDLFALVGRIADGRAVTGVRASLEGDPDGFDVRVHDVEFLAEDPADGGGSELALTFSYSASDQLDRWRAVDWPGKRLTLRWDR